MRRVIFMGTPDFALPSLRKLHQSGFEVVLVVSQPDKPRGRSKQLVMPEVKAEALALGLPVYQPAGLKSPEVMERLAACNPDFIVVAAYGKILPKEVLELPSKACVNVHGSLLPKYRGAAPIQRAVLNGEKITGVTTMLMGEGLDTGDMLLKAETKIGENETAAALFDRLSVLGADLLIETLNRFDSLTPIAQVESEATYAPMIDKSLCPIDWSDSAQTIHCKVRALAQWPVATAKLNGKIMKIHEGRIAEPVEAPSGTVVENKKRLIVACGGGTAYEVLTLQLEGKKKMSADAFLLGHRIEVGERFDN